MFQEEGNYFLFHLNSCVPSNDSTGCGRETAKLIPATVNHGLLFGICNFFLNSTEEGQVFTEPRPRVHNVVYHVCRLLMSSHKTTQDVGLWKIRDYTHHVKCRTTFHARSKK